MMFDSLENLEDRERIMFAEDVEVENEMFAVAAVLYIAAQKDSFKIILVFRQRKRKK